MQQRCRTGGRPERRFRTDNKRLNYNELSLRVYPVDISDQSQNVPPVSRVVVDIPQVMERVRSFADQDLKLGCKPAI